MHRRPGSSWETFIFFLCIVSLPIVFVLVTDPLFSGFVQSLGRPGGNVTGLSVFESSVGGKWLALLKEAAPAVSRVSLLFNAMPHHCSHVTSAGSCLLNGMVRPRSCPASDESGKGLQRQRSTPCPRACREAPPGHFHSSPVYEILLF